MHTIEVQPEFVDVIAEVSNGTEKSQTFWVSVDGRSFSLTVESDDLVCYSCKTDPRVSMIKNSGRTYVLTTPKGGKCKLRAPKAYLSPEISSRSQISSRSEISLGSPRQSTLNSVAVSEDGCTIVTGDSEGTIAAYHRESGLRGLAETMKVADAHFSDVLKVVLFPSWEVALSMGLDYQVKLWGLKSGENPRTFAGVQKKTLTDIELIARGRNFVSSSMDGTACLWECGSGKCLDTFNRPKDTNDPVLSLHISQYTRSLTPEEAETGPYYGCNGKRLYLGHASGVVSVWDLTDRTFVGEIDTDAGEFGGVNSILVVDKLLYVGYEKKAVVKCFRVNLFRDQFVTECAWQTWVRPAQDASEVKKLSKYGDDCILVLSSETLIVLGREDGESELRFVGFDGTLNDVQVLNDDGVIACGKDGLLIEF